MAPTVFFGYSSQPPMRAETIREASRTLDSQGQITAVPWEDLQIAGRYVIDQIQAAIKAGDVAAFDLTQLNHNVMFELGYAIGTDRRIWLLRDVSEAQSKRLWDKIKLLTTIGYSPFVSSYDLVAEWHKQRPDLAAETVFKKSISGSLSDPDRPSLFYLRGLYETDAERKIYRRVRQEESAGILVIVADPAEASVETLSWYAQQIFASDAVIAHLTSPNRLDADIHNARCAFVSGLASGMGKPVLMLAEGDFLTPIDYRDVAYNYGSASAAGDRANEWLKARLAEGRKRAASGPIRARALSLAVGLRQLRLGDPVAENESSTLTDYFVETAAFDDLMEDRHSIFVGRKGTGKTANLLAAAEQLAGDKRNLVVVIKPDSYELDSITELVSKYREFGEQGYMIESLWKFLIYSEIAKQEYERLTKLPERPSDASNEGTFLRFVEANGLVVLEDFAVRLETAVEGLRPSSHPPGIAQKRARIAETLHSGLLQGLREHLGRALSDRNRVVVLIDNLDKAWTRSADLESLSVFILGLLTSAGRIQEELRSRTRSNKSIAFTLSVFLRSDIFVQVKRFAREPDKLPVRRIAWGDPELLLRVIEERYVAGKPNAQPDEFWENYFCRSVKGLNTPSYILEHILPRPRDLIYFCRAAIAAAVNAGHGRVEPADIDDAERSYSQFAFEALQVENGISIEEMENVLYEFYGESSRVPVATLMARLRKAQVGEAKVLEVVEHLYALGFLGVEVQKDEVVFAQDVDNETATKALLRRRLEAGDERLIFWIHPAFRSYLEVREET